MDVRRVVDLTHPVRTGSPVFPGDPEVRLTPAATIAADGVDVTHLSLGTHTGTHVDAPSHVRAGGARLDDLDPAVFTGTGVVADVTGRPPRTPIGWADLAPVAAALRPGRMLLVRTGWDRYWGTDAYLDHPHLDAGAARRVLALGVRVIGLDTASIDATRPEPAAGAHLPAHHAVAAAGGVVAENLANLGAIDFPGPLVTLAPLALAGADGSPVRALAMWVVA